MKKTVNVGIFAHIDAGKTTLTEQLLLLGGALRTAGSVDDGTASCDFLSVERRRGISVRDAAAAFSYRSVCVNLIDTPGHADFAEETQLALSAVDVGVLVVSAVEGVQAQTELLLRTMLRRNMPIAVFVNKIDRAGAQPERVVSELKKFTSREIVVCNRADGTSDNGLFLENAVTCLGDEALLERYVLGDLQKSGVMPPLSRACKGGLIPLVFGSAKLGRGCEELLGVLTDCFAAEGDINAPFSAFVYQVEHRNGLGKVAHVRVFGGKLGVREEVFNCRTQSKFKASQIKSIRGERYSDLDGLEAGEVGAIVGLGDVKAGDILGLQGEIRPVTLSSPYLRIRLRPEKEEALPALKTALEQLTDELPSLAVEWIAQKRELNVNASGTVQAEILKEIISDRFGLSVIADEPSIIYKETPKQAGWGFECYTMPKPCWAVVKFYIEPMPRGSGLVYESTVSEKKIAYRYQEHVKTAVPRALMQGMFGWEVTDLKVTLVDGEDHPQHTHPLDFFTATPMGIMDGLRNCGTQLLEPRLSVRISAPEASLGKIVGELVGRRAELEAPVCEGGRFSLSAVVPASEALDLSERIAALSGGRASYSALLCGYFPCPEGMGKMRERVGIDPLDRSKYILHVRGAL